MSERIEALLAEFVERNEAGEGLDVEAFLKRHPEDADELREALHDLASLENMFPTTESPQEAPERIGPYRVICDLGRGGMGRVYQVVHEDRPAETLALKQVHPLVTTTSRTLERFRREGTILAELDHPGIVKIRDVQAGASTPYLVMDLVEGSTLATLLSNARGSNGPKGAIELPGEGPTLVRIARFVSRIARAVDVIHGMDLLHRDLKPANVIVKEDGMPVLIDFGLAVHEGSETLTASGDLLGTPHYMAPEQARGERADVRTDVYGLGAVLYELLTLRLPHPGRDPLEVLQHITHRPVISVSRLNAHVPAPLRTIVARALSWKRGRRYHTAGLLADDLDCFLEGLPPRARRAGVVEHGEDFLRFHPRLAMGLGMAILFLASLPALLPGESIDREAEIDRARKAGTIAWLAGDSKALEEAASGLERHGGTPGGVALLRSRARGEDPEPTGEPAVDAIVQGLADQEREELESAVKSFSLATLESPDWILPMVLLARAAVATGDEKLAEDEFTAAARLLPESSDLAIEVAKFHTANERYSASKRVLTRALTQDPENWQLWFQLGKAQALTGDQEATLQSVIKSMEFAPRPDDPLKNLYAATVDRLGKHEMAQEMFRGMIERYPENSLLHFNLAYSFDLECKLLGARESYLRSLQLNPNRLNTIISLAQIASGSNRKNCEACKVAFEENPELYDPLEAERFLVIAIENDRCKTSWVPDFTVKVVERIGRSEAIAAALRATIEGAAVDERVVRVERALRKIEGR